MVVHIGSIKEEELSGKFPLEPSKACYPNHLGIIGAARVITKCRPALAVISEFGEEMRQFRCELVRGLQSEVIDKFFQKESITPVPRVVPGDLPFIFDIRERRFYCYLSKEWRPSSSITFEELEYDKQQEKAIFYSDKERKVEEDDRKHKARLFMQDRCDQFASHIYFRKDAI